MSATAHRESESITETAEALRQALLGLETVCGPAQIEADTYRETSIDYELKAAINGWQPWGESAARQFVGDCLECASSDLENMWYKALVTIDHSAVR
ncbi:hypothetical protein [Natronosalvus amylolyticus]|uniref:hypothetical protein n=1 Tax=Natronosalvus amylolyticus TaxID=2961994 RepID=UPI0020C9C0D2|nr:hypothetical protein [Natronosalvus amylolyticus]